MINISCILQNLVNSTILRLNINTQSSEHSAFHLYPQPKNIQNIESMHIREFDKALHEMKKYIEDKASQGIAAAIMLEGECTEYGVSFGNQIVPVHIIQAQLQKFMNRRVLNICPMVVDLTMKHHNKENIHGLYVLSIKDNSIDNFIIRQD